MRNYNLLRLIQQSIRQFKLDLSGYNILVPILTKDPAICAIMAAMAGAKNIYVPSRDLEIMNKIAFFQNEPGISSNINFIEGENRQFLSGLDIVLSGKGVPYIDSTYISELKKEGVISILPYNLDFNHASGVNIDECTRRKIPVVAVDPEDENLMLYKHLAHLTARRCAESGIDLLRSKVLLMSNGKLLDNILSYLKASGSQVYVAHTDKPEDRSYILKHLPETDAIIVADYPIKSTLVIGNEGFLRIEDILSINPEVKIIHIAGKMQVNPLESNRIYFKPENIVPNTLNVNIEEIGLRAAVEIAAAAMKVADSLIKSKDRTLQPNDSIVCYNIINADGPVILGKVMF